MGVSPFTVHVFCVCPAYFYPRASLMCVLLVSVSLYRLCIGLFLCRCASLCLCLGVLCLYVPVLCAGVLVSSWGVFGVFVFREVWACLCVVCVWLICCGCVSLG